jgi:hypothetical protein
MRTKLSVLVLLSIFAGFANATSCYTLVDQKNAVVYQSTKSPIDLSRKISDEIDIKFPGDHLIITSGEDCHDINKRISKDAGKNTVESNRVDLSNLFSRYEVTSSESSSNQSANYSILRRNSQNYGSSHTPGTDVYVKSYSKSDGSIVKAHTRSASR